MAGTAARPVSWGVPCIKEAYMMHICWIWQVLVPLHHKAITREIAAELWMRYRAEIHKAVEAKRSGNPVSEQSQEIKAMQHWSNELWLLYVQAN